MNRSLHDLKQRLRSVPSAQDAQAAADLMARYDYIGKCHEDDLNVESDRKSGEGDEERR